MLTLNVVLINIPVLNSPIAFIQCVCCIQSIFVSLKWHFCLTGLRHYREDWISWLHHEQHSAGLGLWGGEDGEHYWNVLPYVISDAWQSGICIFGGFSLASVKENLKVYSLLGNH